MADLFNLDPVSSAVVSDCGTYRYRLERTWNEWQPKVAFIMLNPSTADADLDDPTIRRCKSFALAWGFGGLIVGNLFALRATDPDTLRAHPDPVGPENDRWLDEITLQAREVVCAWGIHGTLRGRDALVAHQLRGHQLKVLRLTTQGHPGHPLYIAGSARPKLWERTAPHG